MSEETTSPAVSAAEQKEIERVAKLTDEQVLKETGHGKFGPGLVGKPLADRAAKLLKGTAGGKFGPAIMDPDYAKKQAALREQAEEKLDPIEDDGTTDTDPNEPENHDDEDELEPEGEVDPANLKDPRNPWSYVTLSGAKILAQQAQVSHKPGIKRKDLIAALQAANVVPPPIPEDDEKGQAGDGAQAPE